MEAANENPLRLVAYCGLYCGVCANRNRIPPHAKLLQEALRNEGMHSWYQYVPSMKHTFPTFWKFLDNLVAMDCTCRTGGGPPDCKIRECAKQNEVDTCPFCLEYPCSHIERLAEHYVSIIQDGKRLKKIGLNVWAKEQEERAERSVVYSDTRIPWDNDAEPVL